VSNAVPATARPATSRCLALCVAAGCLLLHAGSARADGDPASDVLISQAVFVPGDAGISAHDAARLAALARAARAARFPLRIALIASAYDLGSVGVLWRKPRTYARFLGTELLPFYRGRLLVEMPSGFGLYHGKRPVRRELALLAGISIGPGGAGLVAAAAAATRRLASAAGRRLVVPKVAARAAPARGRQLLALWLAFAVGLAIMAAAWVLSLRFRPLHGVRPLRSRERS
jgi:hypothetical protein